MPLPPADRLTKSVSVPIATDHRIQMPGGEAFAREWRPAGAADQPPLVLIHDSLGSVAVWRDFPAQLADGTGRRVIAYDRLGFGESDARTDRLTTRFVSEEAQIYLPCLLRHFQLERFIAFGHSVGGGMAVCAGAALAGSCVAIVTESAQMFAEDRTLQGIAAARIDFQDDANMARLRRYHGDKAPWVLEAWTGSWLSPQFATWNLRTELSQIRCPILALHGDLDEFGSLKHPEMVEELAGGPVDARILEGCGHLPHREQPASVVEVVSAFLTTG